MDSSRPDALLASLIHQLKNDREGVAGSLGESTASLLAYMEQLERRIKRLEEHERQDTGT